ncbi:MAG TPA: phosphoribosyltransferase [Methanoregulaceae archaeon]|nr:phosphoribosyltransferase [Methanolinea sp.]HPJ74544.1 phosphoribosyltransferase [Methanoregulaceae archaeon]
MIPESFPVELVTWARSYELGRKLAGLVRKSGYSPDLIIAIGRGGYVPGRVVADLLLMDCLTSFKVEHWGVAAERRGEAVVRYPLSVDIKGMKVLVIDDVTDTGDTLAVSVDYLRECMPAEIRTGVLQHKTCSTFLPDYYAETVSKWHWIVYPWAVFEDLSGFAEKVLREGERTAPEIFDRLGSLYGISVDPEMLDEILCVLAGMGKITEMDGKYTSIHG